MASLSTTVAREFVLAETSQEEPFEMTIPEGYTAIGQDAFYMCTGLTSVTIPEGVTTIGDYAFYGCAEIGRAHV